MNDFEVLGVRPGASREEIMAAYRRRVREVHPDATVTADGRPPAGTAEAFMELTEARRRALAIHAALGPIPVSAPRPVRRPQALGPFDAAGPVVPPQRRGSVAGGRPTRDGDPMLTLLTVPQRCARGWPPEALELWALAVVPAARGHLAESRLVVEAAGVALSRHRTVATAHVALTLTLTARGSRRYALLAERLPSAYFVLERELPASVAERLPAPVTQVGWRRRSPTLLAVGAGLTACGVLLWADLPALLLG